MAKWALTSSYTKKKKKQKKRSQHNNRLWFILRVNRKSGALKNFCPTEQLFTKYQVSNGICCRYGFGMSTTQQKEKTKEGAKKNPHNTIAIFLVQKLALSVRECVSPRAHGFQFFDMVGV